MKTLYIHIGHYKTGTSAIQKYCAENVELLGDNGYYYSPIARAGGETVNHGGLSLSLAGKYGFVAPAWYNGTMDVEEVYRDFLEDAKQTDLPNIVISSEEFLQLGLCDDSMGAVTELKDRLAEFDVKIVQFIREPMALLESWYNEVNKGAFGTRNFPMFFKSLNPDFLGQYKIYQSFSEVFGSANMIVKTYHKGGMDHIREFLCAIGSKIDPGEKEFSVQKGQDREFLELSRLSKDSKHSYEVKTLSRVGSLEKLGAKVDKINADYTALAALSDMTKPSQLSLVNVFQHLQDLLRPLVAHSRANDKEASVLRDAALSIEMTDLKLAFVLMQTAHLIRPSGKIIQRKMDGYADIISRLG